VLAMVQNGKNVFFTGPAGKSRYRFVILMFLISFKHLGTGKSVLLKEIIRTLRNTGKSVAVTAPTGIAGLNIGGTTIHSFAGIGLGTEPENVLVKKIRGSKLLFKRWTEISILIIDESELLFADSIKAVVINEIIVSMLDAVLFDKLVSQVLFEYIGAC